MLINKAKKQYTQGKVESNRAQQKNHNKSQQNSAQSKEYNLITKKKQPPIEFKILPFD